MNSLAADSNLFEVRVEGRARRFLKKNSELHESFRAIEQHLAQSPYTGTRINHLKGRYNCSRRWREGTYRILYAIYAEERVVSIFDVGHRQNIYN